MSASPAPPPRHKWLPLFSFSSLTDRLVDSGNLEGLLGRKVDERAPLTPAEKLSVVRSEALTAEPPWVREAMRSGPWDRPSAREFATSIGYVWPARKKNPHFVDAQSYFWRIVNLLRVLTPRGRQRRVLRALLLEEVYEMRWKHIQTVRYHERTSQVQDIEDWWGELHTGIDQDLMDDLRAEHPDYTSADLKAKMDGWTQKARAHAVERARFDALARRPGTRRPEPRGGLTDGV